MITSVMIIGFDHARALVTRLEMVGTGWWVEKPSIPHKNVAIGFG